MMEIFETRTSSAGSIEVEAADEQERTGTSNAFRFRDDIVRLNFVPYADAEPPVLYARPEINEFMLKKPA